MAREVLDGTGNTSWATLVDKINTMLAEVYATIAGAISATSLVLTGLMSSATATVSGLVTTGSLKVDTGTKTATASAGAATLAKFAGVITSEALTTAAAATYSLVVTTTALGVAATDYAFASVANGTNTQGVPVVTRVTCGTNSVTIVVTNLHASEALNGTLKIAYEVHKA